MNKIYRHNNTILETVKLHTEKKMKAVHSSHGIDHIKRVVHNALHIASTEPEADLFIVEASAWLHDIARHIEDANRGKICHADEGALIATAFLKELSLPDDQIAEIHHCIASHRFRSSNPPRTLEAKILFDADKLDSIGATGIGRAFLFSGEIGARLHNSDIDASNADAYGEEDTAYREYMVKLRHVKEKMLTEEGRHMAAERDSFMKEFFKRLDHEAQGLL